MTWVTWAGFGVLVAFHVVSWALKRRLRYWQRRLATEERHGLDSTIRWGYANGYRDAVNQLDIEVGLDTVVIEYRERFSATSREVLS